MAHTENTLKDLKKENLIALVLNLQNDQEKLMEKTLKLYGPFLWMGFNCLKARATSRRQFTFYH